MTLEGTPPPAYRRTLVNVRNFLLDMEQNEGECFKSDLDALLEEVTEVLRPKEDNAGQHPTTR